MEKLNNKKALLDRIHLSEGVDFEYNEKEILKEYQKQNENTSSLSIKILSILGGFFAALAFLGFLIIIRLNDEHIIIALGIGFIISAILLSKVYNKLSIDTFSVSFYIIGVSLFFAGFSGLHIANNTTVPLLILIALIALLITQNYILSFISVLVISGSSLGLIISNDRSDLIHLYITITTIVLTYFFLNEAKIISSSKKLCKLYNPIRIGLVISLLFGLISIGENSIMSIAQNRIWISSIVMIFLNLYLVYLIMKRIEIEALKDKILIYALTSLVLIPLLFAPFILGVIVLILISFLVNYKTGLVIGILSIVYFISRYYYDLDFTLLTKSILLFVSGIIFLLLYILTNKKLNTHEKI